MEREIGHEMSNTLTQMTAYEGMVENMEWVAEGLGSDHNTLLQHVKIKKNIQTDPRFFTLPMTSLKAF